MAESDGENCAASATDSSTSSEIYINDLAEIQVFLDQLHQLVAEREVGAENSEDILRPFADDDAYLAALRFKKGQLAGVRALVASTPNDSTSGLMTEMLDEVEPLCGYMIETLSKLLGEQPPPAELMPKSAGSTDEASASVHLSTNDDLVAPLELVHHYPTSTGPDINSAPNDVEKPDDDVAQDDAGDSVARAGHISAANENASTENVSFTSSPVLFGQVLVQQSADIQIAAAVANSVDITDKVPNESVSPVIEPVLLAVNQTVEIIHHPDNEQQQQPEHQAEDEDFTSFVILSSSEDDYDETGVHVGRPRQRATDDWILLCIPADAGQRSLDDWRDGWKDDHSAKNKLLGTTMWHIDRHAPISVTRTEDQPLASAYNQAQELYLLETFDKYKCAKEYELMRNFMVTFEGMDGTDRGAMSREFFYLNFEACISGMYKGSSLLTGDRGRLIPTNDDNLMDADAFRCLGKMIAHAVRHGCRGLPGLSPAIKHYLVRGQGLSFIENECLPPPISIDDVADVKLYNLLAKLESRTTLTSADHDDLLERMQNGGHHIQLNERTRHLVIQKLLIDYIYHQRSRQIEAIAAGMELFKLRSFLRENSTKENISFVFPSVDDVAVDPDLFMAAVVSRGDDFDALTLDFLKQFLLDLHASKIENKGVSDLVQFVTGSPYLPERVVVSFKPAKHPISHACHNEIELPTAHRQYDSFRDAMVYALLHGMDFSRE